MSFEEVAGAARAPRQDRASKGMTGALECAYRDLLAIDPEWRERRIAASGHLDR